MSKTPIVPVWTSPLKRMPEVNEVVLCMLRHHATNRIQEHKLRYVIEDDQSWRTTDGAELSYDWEVLCWKAEDPRTDIHDTMAMVHKLIEKCSTALGMETAVFLGDVKAEDHQVVRVNKKDLEQIAEAMRSLIFAPSGGLDSSDRERLLYCARVVRTIANLGRDGKTLGDFYPEAVGVVRAIKVVLNISDDEFAAADVEPLKPINVELTVKRILEQNLSESYYCVKDWNAWGQGKMRASDFVRLTDNLSGRVDGITQKIVAALKKD